MCILFTFIIVVFVVIFLFTFIMLVFVVIFLFICLPFFMLVFVVVILRSAIICKQVHCFVFVAFVDSFNVK